MLLIAAATFAACTSDTSSSSSATDDKSGAANGSCQGADGFTGTAVVGASCAEAKDCAPACCACDNGTPRSWASASCVEGQCASSTTTCGRTKNNSFFCAP